MTTSLVSVVIPCRDEGPRIIAVLDDLARQRGLTEAWEVVVADGSSDETRDLLAARIAAGQDPFRLQVVDNPRRSIPAGLNQAVAAAAGTFIIRIDAHSRIDPDYLATMLANLRVPGVDITGGLVYWIPRGEGLAARIIAWCLNHPLGNGGTPGRNPQPCARRVVHSPLSCYRREVWERIGGYDPSLLSNEDFDFDWRAAQAGFAVWSFPAPIYRAVARADLAGLIRQRWRYGYWKAQVVKRHPRSVSFRQYLPPCMLISGLALLTATAMGWMPWLVLACLSLLIVLVVLVALVQTGERSHPARQLRMSVCETPAALLIAWSAFAIIHAVWSIGLLWGLLCRQHDEDPAQV